MLFRKLKIHCSNSSYHISLSVSPKTNTNDKEERRMLAMDQIHHIRELYFVQGLNISEIANKMKLDWKTVRKYVDMTDFNTPEPIAVQKELCPMLNPYKEKINEWLVEDKKAPRKQRHTAKRIYNRLLEEIPGFNCSIRTVSSYVKVRKEELNLKKPEGYIPLIHYPGESQGDFGTAIFFENGIPYDGKYFVLDFPYSNSGYLQLHRGENLECLLESLVAIFEHIGGVPSEIWFDNTKTIVTKVIYGGGREITERFSRFQEHYGFQAFFMNPASGNEKGGVENKVGYDRRNMLVPVPRFLDLADYNKDLLKKCDKDSDREHYRYAGETIEERFETDRAALKKLPEKPFDTASYEQVSVDKWGKFTLNGGKHTYSAAPEYAGQTIWLKITAEHIKVMDSAQNEITTHRRLYGNESQESMNWLPYLECIAKKPRSLRNSGIFPMLPETMRDYLNTCKNSDTGQILKMLCELTRNTGFESALNTVDQAIQYSAKDPDSLKALYRRLYSDIPELPAITNLTVPANIVQFPVNLKDYDELLKKAVHI